MRSAFSRTGLEDDRADVDGREVVIAEPDEHAPVGRLLDPVRHAAARIHRLATVEATVP
jgi:hypothetical protein